jgi:hypothetical protein
VDENAEKAAEISWCTQAPAKNKFKKVPFITV